jgi:hypothetical protein
MTDEYLCPLCNKPVALENAKTDENGQPIHEDCYIRTLATATEKASPERRAS